MTWSAQSDIAASSLTQALATSMGINPMRAEELKKERGILGTGPNYELSTIMMPFLDAIVNEVKKADYTYRQQFPTAMKTERVVLTGGGANLSGIEKYFEKEFGMPVVKAIAIFAVRVPRRDHAVHSGARRSDGGRTRSRAETVHYISTHQCHSPKK